MASGSHDNLDATQERAIIALLNHPTIREAAKSLDIGERTLHTWLDQPAFSSAYRRARRQAFAQAISLTQRYAPMAVQTLAKVASDPNVPAAAKVSASTALLKFSRESIELDDVVERVEALEADMKERKAS